MRPRAVRTAKRPDPEQKKLIKEAGLDPEKWLVMEDSANYLYLVDRGMEQRDFVIIDKATSEIMREKEPWRRPKQTRAQRKNLT